MSDVTIGLGDEPEPLRWSSAVLNDYFLRPLPPLAGHLWAAALTEGLGRLTEYRQDGRLYMLGTPKTPPTSIAGPEEAADYWGKEMRPAWEHRLSELVFPYDGDPVWRWEVTIQLWRDGILDYFRNPMMGWVDRARKELDGDLQMGVACRPTHERLSALERVRVAVQDDEEALALVMTGEVVTLSCLETRAGRELRSYLVCYGHYSNAPDDFSRPYPIDDPAQLARRLASGRPLCRRVEAVTPSTPSARLLEIAEEDNAFKYRLCAAVRRTVMAVGDHLAARDRIDHPTAIWRYTPAEVRVLLEEDRRGPQTESVMTPVELVVDPVGLDAAAHGTSSTWPVRVLAPGATSGVIWDGDSDPPDDEALVLRTSNLGVGVEAELAQCVGLVAPSGDAFSHAAVYGRDLDIVVVVDEEAYRCLRPGDLVRIDGSGGTAGMVTRVEKGR